MQEEDLIVTFLQTLTDGFTTLYPDSDTFTGTVHDRWVGRDPGE